MEIEYNLVEPPQNVQSHLQTPFRHLTPLKRANVVSSFPFEKGEFNVPSEVEAQALGGEERS